MSQLAGRYFGATIYRLGTMILAFLFNFILARWFLSPHEFGLIGMLQIFIAVGATTITGGFGQTLVQKRSLKKTDVNTVFTFNVVVSILMYAALYFFAPWVADFYEVQELKTILRYLSLVLVINAFQLVPYSLLIRYQAFSTLCVVAFVSTLAGYVLGFVLAWQGFGVWSLVAATLSISFFELVWYNAISRVRSRLSFSWTAFYKLMPFSGYIYLATLLEQVYINALAMILGKRFDAVTLGYYTQASKLQSVPAGGVQEISHQVLLPEFSRYQKENELLKGKYLRNLSFLTLVASWVFSVLYVVAEPAVLILYTDKWLPSVWMLQALCPAGLFFVLFYIPTLLIRAIGKARSYFLLLLVEYSLAIVAIAYLSSRGLGVVLYGLVGVNAAFFLINAAYVGRLGLGISFWVQLLKVVPTVALFGAIAYLALRAIGWFGIGSIGWHLVVGIMVPSGLLLFYPEVRNFLFVRLLGIK